MLLGKKLWKTYRETQAVRNVSIAIKPGETVGLVGETGSGKSTLARILCRLTVPDAGAVTLDGETAISHLNVKKFRKRVQIVFQDSSGSLDPRMTVYKILKEPLDNYALGSSAEKQERIRELLESVDLSFNLSRRYPHEISGGQRQRVVIARALAVKPDYLLCDEPLSGLDTDAQEHILRLLIDLGNDRPLGYLFISHDLILCTRMSRRLYVMFAGSIVERLASDEIRYAVHPYTRSLFEHILEPDKKCYPAKTGTDFAIADRGCAFRLQCRQIVSLCEEEPAETLISAGHWVRCYHPF
jgi:ABC-type dipeptide/oligopeptide/nickel transport system ATPase subunit